jgi:hypothetical protein
VTKYLVTTTEVYIVHAESEEAVYEQDRSFWELDHVSSIDVEEA